MVVTIATIVVSGCVLHHGDGVVVVHQLIFLQISSDNCEGLLCMSDTVVYITFGSWRLESKYKYIELVFFYLRKTNKKLNKMYSTRLLSIDQNIQ